MVKLDLSLKWTETDRTIFHRAEVLLDKRPYERCADMIFSATVFKFTLRSATASFHLEPETEKYYESYPAFRDT